MARLSRFGSKKLQEMVPDEYSLIVCDRRPIAPFSVPTGASKSSFLIDVECERNDEMKYGEFRSRFEHLWRYHEASKCLSGVVVDVGCGTGYGSAILSGPTEVVGIDISRDALLYARTEYPGGEFVCGSAGLIPLRNTSVDAVIAFEMIEHIDDAEKFIGECRRVLKKDGILFVSSPNPAHFWNLVKHRLLGHSIPAKAYPGNLYHVREYTYDEMHDLLTREGFDLVWTKGQTIPIVTGLGRIVMRFLSAGSQAHLDSAASTGNRCAVGAGAYERIMWIVSAIGERFPRLSFTVVYAAKLK